ncbi:hypothetical protein PUN28_006448 [Cardiocondyla obscurior]|uniref:Uncharacterized protein n=1 Tax=Cardiocondyla obscurior TaxID=286306 RepID=A0AAW2GBK3_9HYME
MVVDPKDPEQKGRQRERKREKRWRAIPSAVSRYPRHTALGRRDVIARACGVWPKKIRRVAGREEGGQRGGGGVDAPCFNRAERWC